MSIKELIEKIQSDDPNVRGDAWQGAGNAGPEAVKPLADVALKADFEVSRAAKRALWKIVHHVGRPGAEDEAKAVLAPFIDLLGQKPPASVLRDLLWMVSELPDPVPAVQRVAALLSDEEVREDARMTLERIPGETSIAALKAGLEAAPQDFKQNIVQSLRARGQKVEGFPCQKLVPKKKTKVQPVGRQVGGD